MRYLFVILLYLFPALQAISQKADIMVVKTLKASDSEWKILDDQYRQVYSGEYYFREDTIIFSLEADKHYYFQVSVNDIFISDTSIYSLWLNREETITVTAEIGPGDHFLPFFSGIKQDSSKIIGGTNADIADFPWQVYVRAGNYMCGGTIIAPGWILTAAHCLKNEDGSAIPVSEMRIRAGATNPYTSQGSQYFVSQAIVHEQFNPETLANDLAVLRLQSLINVENARPIRLVTAADKSEGATVPGVMTWVTGWGLTQVDPEVMPVILQKVQLPIVSRQTASSVWSSIPLNVIMAGYLNGNKDVCNGDSGGPMVVPVSGEYKIAGIVSWGNENCNTYGGYTEVSAFENWIRTKTGVYEYIPPVPEGDVLVCEGVISSAYSVDPVAGATSYEWELYPGDAGTVSGTSENATVTWNLRFQGLATVKLRVTINGTLSEWSRLDVVVARNTRIVSQSGNKVLCPGDPLNLSVSADGYNLKYIWYKNGSVIVYTNSEIKISGATISHSGDYVCEVQGACGTVFSATMSVTVHPLTRINDITDDITVGLGDDVNLEVDATGHNLTYLWKKNNTEMAYSGSSILLEDADANDIGLYQVTVSGTCGTIESDKFYLFVNNEDNPEDPGVYLWPTVTATEFKVALSNGDFYNISVFSGYGKLMKEIKRCRYQTTVDIRNYPKGMYFITVYERNFRITRKIIKD